MTHGLYCVTPTYHTSYGNYLEVHLTEDLYLVGDAFTVADAYCYTILNWAKFVDVDMSPWSKIVSYVERVGTRPKVLEAIQAEYKAAN